MAFLLCGDNEIFLLWTAGFISFQVTSFSMEAWLVFNWGVKQNYRHFLKENFRNFLLRDRFFYHFKPRFIWKMIFKPFAFSLEISPSNSKNFSSSLTTKFQSFNLSTSIRQQNFINLCIKFLKCAEYSRDNRFYRDFSFFFPGKFIFWWKIKRKN